MKYCFIVFVVLMSLGSLSEKNRYLVSTGLPGTIQIPNEPFVDPDNPVPGPVEYLKPGTNTFKVW
ncbi:MAG: hypothetical protein GY790_09300 [Bacteroidetes bacterium]|nr:hypothetical protein [Bacteroidota bacterium]